MAQWRFRVVSVLWLLVLSGYILAGVEDVPFHGDESTTIWMSKDYAYLFITDELERVRYNEPPIDAAEQQLRLITGSLTKYLMGFSWQVNGYDIADINEQWHWGFDFDWNVTNGHMPGDDLLRAGRWYSALMLAAGVWVIFLIGLRAGGSVAAFAASFFYAINPALLVNGRRAMFEGGLILFLLLTVLLGLYFLRQRTWWAAVALGIVAGLALSAKHSAVFTLALVLTVCLLLVLFENRPSLQNAFRPISKLITAGLIAVSIFYALHPILWGDGLITRAEQVVDGRSAMLEGQVGAFGGYDGLSDQLIGSLRQTFLLEPQYYEVPGWDVYINGKVLNYEQSGLAGFVTGLPLVGVGVGVLFIIGLRGAITARSTDTDFDERLLIVAWAVGMLLITTFITPIEWQRYYLMAILPIVILSGVGMGVIVDALSRLFTQQFRADAPTLAQHE